MTKTEIEYLLKAGYSIAEIMAMENENVPEPTKEPDKTGEEPDKTPENEPEKPLSEQLAELRGELKALRELTHEQNRTNNVIENPGKKLTFEENVEELIKEVSK